jgi:L-alanine-DL-glutamate epimerase-like enolase superfamily enzyme
MPAFREYRRWAVESAAADLALRQAGTSLAEALGRTAEPIRFVVSLRLGEPPSLEPVTRRLAAYPFLQFKLDSSPTWDDAFVAALAETGAVESVDFKGAYKGTVVDTPTDPALYRRVAETLPEAFLEDPDLTVAEAAAALEPHRDRITWDAPIHGVADIEKLAFLPRTINVKPSRIGTWRELLRTYEWCAERDITCYGGGQSELGVGRGQIQYLASIFHPHAPNDIAPSGYDWAEFPETGLPPSPLDPDLESTGFRRRS